MINLFLDTLFIFHIFLISMTNAAERRRPSRSMDPRKRTQMRRLKSHPIVRSRAKPRTARAWKIDVTPHLNLELKKIFSRDPDFKDYRAFVTEIFVSFAHSRSAKLIIRAKILEINWHQRMVVTKFTRRISVRLPSRQKNRIRTMATRLYMTRQELCLAILNVYFVDNNFRKVLNDSRSEN